MFCQSSTPSAQSDESVTVTAVGCAIIARSTITAVYDGLYTYPVSRFEFLVDAISELFNGTTEFMAKGEGHLLTSDRMRCGRTN